MAIDITAPAIATTIACVVASALTLYLNRKNEVKSLHDQLDNILKIAIQHPYLESATFVKTWQHNKLSEDERYVRYDLYCTLLFNFLERFCRYFKYKEDDIQKMIKMKEWVRLHKDYWRSPMDEFENIDGYCKEFRDLIDDFLRK
jgi:hypothetical protein